MRNTNVKMYFKKRNKSLKTVSQTLKPVLVHIVRNQDIKPVNVSQSVVSRNID